MKLRTLVCLLCVMLATGMVSKAEEAREETGKRPKVGLVLGGGGARGFAHIGVMQWLEEQQIPVDYVAGTSMGGLIGALYAMGHSPQEMTQLVKHLNWNRLMAAAPPYSDLTFRRKEDLRQYPVRFELGWNKGLSTPSGLVPGHFIGLLFDRLSLPYWEAERFDDLPIPFRCVATDMETGKTVVLDSGSLAMALRATMAIPAVFTPVEFDGKLLADGGLLDNLPVETAKEMGAEVIIAVDVGSPLSDREALNSIPGLANQTITIMMVDKVRQNMRLADIVLIPELNGYETLDFEEFDPISKQGYVAAEDKDLVLRAFSIDDRNWKEHLAARASRRKDLIPAPSSVQVTGTDVDRESKLSRELSTYTDNTLDLDRLEEELTDVYGRGRDYGLGYGVDGTKQQSSLHIRVREKTYGPPFINFGLDINGSEMDDIRFGIRGRVTFLDLGRTGSELRFDGALGTPALLGTEYYAPLKKGFFVAPRALYHRDNRNYFQDGDQLANYRIRNAGAGLDLGYGFGFMSDEIRFGYAISSLDAGVNKGEPVLPSLSGASGRFSLRLKHDGLDHSVIPRRGWRLEASGRHFPHTPGAPHALSQLGGRLLVFATPIPKYTIFGSVRGGTTFEKIAPAPQKFTLGGPLNVGSLSPDELWGSRYAYTNLGLMRQIADSSSFLGGRTVIAVFYEGGTAWEPTQTVNFFHAASGGLLMDSLIGPVFVGGSFGEEGKGKFYFAVGTLFD